MPAGASMMRMRTSQWRQVAPADGIALCGEPTAARPGRRVGVGEQSVEGETRDGGAGGVGGPCVDEARSRRRWRLAAVQRAQHRRARATARYASRAGEWIEGAANDRAAACAPDSADATRGEPVTRRAGIPATGKLARDRAARAGFLDAVSLVDAPGIEISDTDSGAGVRSGGSSRTRSRDKPLPQGPAQIAAAADKSGFVHEVFDHHLAAVSCKPAVEASMDRPRTRDALAICEPPASAYLRRTKIGHRTEGVTTDHVIDVHAVDKPRGSTRFIDRQLGSSVELKPVVGELQIEPHDRAGSRVDGSDVSPTGSRDRRACRFYDEERNDQDNHRGGEPHAHPPIVFSRHVIRAFVDHASRDGIAHSSPTLPR
jgi:hypothetical protein